MNPPTPDEFHHIVVPLSNPRTAPALLNLATALIQPDKGKVTALYIATDNVEDEGTPIDELEPIIQQFIDDQCPVELVTHSGPSVVRGILDATREIRADLIILGVQNTHKGNFEIGPLTEGVAATAPCDVLIYAANRDLAFGRVVIPVDGSDHAHAGARIALHIARSFEVPVEALAIQRKGHSQWEGRTRLRRSLEGLPGAENVRQTIATAGDPVSGLIARIHEDDLLVIGFANRALLQKWLFSSFSKRLLNSIPSPIILTSLVADGEQQGISQHIRRRLTWALPTLTELEQDELAWQADDLSVPNLDYWVLIVSSAIIASAGLLLNNPALIIGAMLVAPLKRPITTFSVGLTIGNVMLIRRALLTIGAGILLSFTVGVIAGKLLVVASPTGQMLAWSHPTLTDAVVALAAGFVGAYATARKHIADTLAGVAISTSLEPAVIMVGLSVAFGLLNLALGAALLFATNMVCIILAGWAVYFWLGMRPRLNQKSRRQQYISWAIVTLLMLPVLIILLRLSNREGAASIINDRLQASFEPAEVVEMRVEDGKTLNILATVRSADPITPQMVEIIQNNLASELDKPVTLNVVVQTVIQAPSREATPELSDNPP